MLAEDPKKSKVEPETVQAVIDDGIKPLMQVALSDGSSFKVTTNHPFYIDAGGRRMTADWIEAGQLLGDRMRTASGHDVTVVGLRYHVGYAHVYTLTIAADHDYFVGTARVSAHNCPLPDRSLGEDPTRGGNYSQREYDTAARIQQERGVTLRRDPSGNVEWFDAGGRSYDSVGGFDAAYFDQQCPHLQEVIRDHQTMANFVPVDVGGFTPTQVAEVEQFIKQHGLGPRAFVVGK